MRWHPLVRVWCCTVLHVLHGRFVRDEPPPPFEPIQNVYEVCSSVRKIAAKGPTLALHRCRFSAIAMPNLDENTPPILFVFFLR